MAKKVTSAAPATKLKTGVVPKPSAGWAKLYTEQATQDLLTLLSRYTDPDQVLTQAGISRVELRKLEGDDEIHATLETRLAGLLATPWRLEPGEGEQVDFIWEQLDRWIEDILTAAWQAVPYGYSVLEAVYEPDWRGRIIWKKVQGKPFEWFKPDRDGTLRYFDQRGNPDGEIVDTVYKFFLTRRRPTYRNPYGEALLARLYWPWFFRSHGWRFWARFLERFGAPLLLAKTPSPLRADRQRLATELAAAVQSAVAVLGRDDEVEAISPANAGEAFEKFDGAINRRIQKVVLGRVITSDLQRVGSNAAQQTDDRVREDRRDADIRMIIPTLQQLVNALSWANFPTLEPPFFTMVGEQGLEADRADRDARLAQAGVVRFTKDYLLRAYDYEPEDIEIPPPGQPPLSANLRASSARFAVPLGKPFTPGQLALESLLEAALDPGPMPLDVSQLRELIQTARTPAELTDKLIDLAGEQWATEDFRELVARTLFAADIMGYAHAETGD